MKAIRILAIFIALLGLFGLSSFLMLKRTKEIGIRKSMGAKGSTISIMFIRDFLKLVLVANLIALPAGYLGIRKWLQIFEYKADMAIWVFILGLFLSFLVATLTVLYHSLKASKNNPIESLRYE